MPSETVGNNLRVFRQARQERPEETAQAVGISRSYLLKIEQGRRTCSTALALRLARHFNTTLDALFFVADRMDKKAI